MEKRLFDRAISGRQNELDLKEHGRIWNPAEKPGYAGVAIFFKIKTNISSNWFA